MRIMTARQSMSVSESLFDAEAALRNAARSYVSCATEDTRKALRSAARSYVAIAALIDRSDTTQELGASPGEAAT